VTHIVVQADDLSGAAETAYSFVEQGLRVRLVLDGARSTFTTEGTEHAALNVDVLVHDSHSRGLSPVQAQERVAAVFRSMPVGGGVLAFKKFDSLWRGNIGAEIAAITEAGHHVVVAGALPHLDRTVVNSQPLVNGQPLIASELWSAEVALPPGDVRALLDPGDPGRVRHLGLSTLREGFGSALLPELLGRPVPSVVVVDGETDDDLRLVVTALLEIGFTAHGRQVVLAGTGATAAALAKLCAHPGIHDFQRSGEELGPQHDGDKSAKPVLAVVGSASGPAREQLRRLEDRGFLLIRVHTQEAIDADFVMMQLACRAALAAGLNVAVTTAESLIDPTRGPDIVGTLATFTAQATVAPVSPNLLLTGGETAREVLVALGHYELTPLTATHHGAVLSQAADGTLVGTKPGSFGDEFALVELYELFTRYSSGTFHQTTSHY
jgi:uncharacterized protein YgbK (DUF1537 family)